MDEAVARGLVAALGVYGAIGLAFAAVFHARGLGRVDPISAHGSLGFRVIVTPGIAALWPWLARAWWRAARRPR